MTAPFHRLTPSPVSVTDQGAGDIYQQVDVFAGARPDSSAMVITIWVEDRHPVLGRAGVGGQPPRPFAGWLQLLGLLSDLVERQEASEATSAGLGGEPDP
jgi:hypothetical protein